jgi:hypothetical protein
MTTRIPGQPDTTGGSSLREPRPLREPLMRFNLLDEISRLAGEPQWGEGDRNSIALAKDARFRVLLSVLRTGATIGEDDADSTMSIHLITGAVTVRRGDVSVALAPGEVAVLEGGSGWQVRADQESAALLTLSWPEEQARV